MPPQSNSSSKATEVNCTNLEPTPLQMSLAWSSTPPNYIVAAANLTMKHLQNIDRNPNYKPAEGARPTLWPADHGTGKETKARNGRPKDNQGSIHGHM